MARYDVLPSFLEVVVRSLHTCQLRQARVKREVFLIVMFAPRGDLKAYQRPPPTRPDVNDGQEDIPEGSLLRCDSWLVVRSESR